MRMLSFLLVCILSIQTAWSWVDFKDDKIVISYQKKGKKPFLDWDIFKNKHDIEVHINDDLKPKVLQKSFRYIERQLKNVKTLKSVVFRLNHSQISYIWELFKFRKNTNLNYVFEVFCDDQPQFTLAMTMPDGDDEETEKDDSQRNSGPTSYPNDEDKNDSQSDDNSEDQDSEDEDNKEYLKPKNEPLKGQTNSSANINGETQRDYKKKSETPNNRNRKNESLNPDLPVVDKKENEVKGALRSTSYPNDEDKNDSQSDDNSKDQDPENEDNKEYLKRKNEPLKGQINSSANINGETQKDYKKKSKTSSNRNRKNELPKPYLPTVDKKENEVEIDCVDNFIAAVEDVIKDIDGLEEDNLEKITLEDCGKIKSSAKRTPGGSKTANERNDDFVKNLRRLGKFPNLQEFEMLEPKEIDNPCIKAICRAVLKLKTEQPVITWQMVKRSTSRGFLDTRKDSNGKFNLGTLQRMRKEVIVICKKNNADFVSNNCEGDCVNRHLCPKLLFNGTSKILKHRGDCSAENISQKPSEVWFVNRTGQEKSFILILTGPGTTLKDRGESYDYEADKKTIRLKITIPIEGYLKVEEVVKKRKPTRRRFIVRKPKKEAVNDNECGLEKEFSSMGI